MICGPDEIGLGEKTDGIMILSDDAKVGVSGSEYFDIKSDTVFEIGLTPNRTDAMSHIGVARDLKAALNTRNNDLKMCLPSVKNFSIDNEKLNIDVKVMSSELCPRYSGLSISNVNVDDSPDWLENRLLSIGVKPINNIVDITNYVLHEIGQPLHAFDADKINGKKIIVDKVQSETSFTTLDEVDRKLSNEDLMICNEKEPMCIAGVFGGIDSGVSKSTKNIFLESAYFNPVSIRKSAKRHNLNTDASFRYERGCDPNITIYALKRAALMIKEICNAEISSEIFDFYPTPIDNNDIKLSFDSLNKIVGQKLDKAIVKNILKNLEIKILDESETYLELSVPTYRVDVTREIDVIEEIMRIYGFNTIPLSEKITSSVSVINSKDSYSIKKLVSAFLSNNGFNEIMNNSLTKSSYNDLVDEIKDENNVPIINPLSSDLNIMRRTLLFSALESIEYNQNRKNLDLKLFEFGKSYHLFDSYIENQHLFLSFTGLKQQENWNSNKENIDFYYVKEYVHTLLERLNISKFKSKECSYFGLSQAMIYSYKGKNLVEFGSVDQNILDKFKIRTHMFLLLISIGI